MVAGREVRGGTDIAGGIGAYAGTGGCDRLGDPVVGQNKLYAGIVYVKDGVLSSDSAFAKSGSLKVTKNDSKYALDFTGTLSDGTSVAMYYSGPLIVAVIPNIDMPE